MLPGTLAQRAGVRTTTYRQDFPYIGLPLRTEVSRRRGSDHPNSLFSFGLHTGFD